MPRLLTRGIHPFRESLRAEILVQKITVLGGGGNQITEGDLAMEEGTKEATDGERVVLLGDFIVTGKCLWPNPQVA